MYMYSMQVRKFTMPLILPRIVQTAISGMMCIKILRTAGMKRQ